MKKTNKNQTTTKAIMVTSKEAIYYLNNEVLNRMHFCAIQRTLDYNDVTILGDNVILFKDFKLAQEVAHAIQHEALEIGGWATIFKIELDECYEQLTYEQIQKSLFGQ